MGKLGYDLELLMGLIDSLEVNHKELVIDLIRGNTLGQAIVSQFKNGDARIRDVIEGNMTSGEDFFKEAAVTFVGSGRDDVNVRDNEIKKVKKVNSTKGKKKNNKGKTVVYTYKKKDYTSVSKLAKDVGMNYMTLYGRLEKGMSVKEAVETPVGKPKLREPIPVKFGDDDYPSISSLAKKFSLNPTKLHYYAIKKGMGIDKAMEHLVKG